MAKNVNPASQEILIAETTNPNPIPQSANPKSQIINIFSPESIQKIYSSSTPIEDICLLLESHYRKVNLRADFDKGKLMAKAEYFVNVLIFLKETFKHFENEVVCKLMNIFDVLINLENDELIDDDYLSLSKKKLNDFKTALNDYNLIPKRKSEIMFSNDPNKKMSGDGKYFLNLKEINELISYLKTDILPYFRLWYNLQNEKREIAKENIQIIINRPIPMMPLSMALIEEKEEKKEETENIKNEDEIKGEEKKEENVNINEGEKVQENNMEEKEESYEDLLEKLGLNEETKKIIKEKIEELHTNINNKIENRKKALEDKVKELEENVKGGKKK